MEEKTLGVAVPCGMFITFSHAMVYDYTRLCILLSLSTFPVSLLCQLSNEGKNAPKNL